MVRARFMFALLFCYSLCVSALFAEDSSRWQSDFSLAQTEAEKMNRPVLLHFYADWCGPCKQMEATVFRAARFQELLGTEVVGVKINGDHHADLVSRFRISAYPADVLLSPEGKELKRSVGSLTLEKYLSLLESTTAVYRQNSDTTPSLVELRGTQPIVEKTTLKLKHEGLALNGYSPVALIRQSAWVKGAADYEESHQGLTYRFANTDEQAEFQKQPEDFVPMYLGCDPVTLKESGAAVAGNSEFGATYQGRIYFMANEKHQEEFLASPESYIDLPYVVVVDDATAVAQTKVSSPGE